MHELTYHKFTDSDGGVAQEFVQKLQSLSSDNSKGELSIERYLIKSEEAYFDRVRKDKLSSAASYISSHRDSVWSSHGTLEDRSICTCLFFSMSWQPRADKHAAAPGTPSTHPFGESDILQYGEDFVIMNRVQIALARRIFGWPLYTIIIALGQASCLFFITPFVY